MEEQNENNMMNTQNTNTTEMLFHGNTSSASYVR